MTMKRSTTWSLGLAVSPADDGLQAVTDGRRHEIVHWRGAIVGLRVNSPRGRHWVHHYVQWWPSLEKSDFRYPKHRTQELVGLGLVVLAETLIVSARTPVSDFYFPIVWFGLILFLDGTVLRARGRSLLSDSPGVFALMLPVSAAFWWVFEGFDAAVHNWRYVGADSYDGIAFVALASISFSTVLLAVWETAQCVDSLLPAVQKRLPPIMLLAISRAARRENAEVRGTQLTARPARLEESVVLPLAFAAGILCLVLPIIYPRYAFGLIWGCLFLLLDPVNFWMGRSSLLHQALRGHFRTAVAFGTAALICGFFWESWNYWATEKWVYSVPHVGHPHLFEMPLPGYLGYVPFGLELYAMANFVLPSLLGLVPVGARWAPSPAGPWPPPESGAPTRPSRDAVRGDVPRRSRVP